MSNALEAGDPRPPPRSEISQTGGASFVFELPLGDAVTPHRTGTKENEMSVEDKRRRVGHAPLVYRTPRRRSRAGVSPGG